MSNEDGVTVITAAQQPSKDLAICVDKRVAAAVASSTDKSSKMAQQLTEHIYNNCFSFTVTMAPKKWPITPTSMNLFPN